METKICKECGRELNIDKFKNDGHGGVRNICCDCTGKKIEEGRKKHRNQRDFDSELAAARRLRLQDFTPRELMTRLHELGYEGTLRYTRVEEINIANF